jgi:para-aminobenzoate synthetase component 1
MYHMQSLPWCEPLELAAGIDEPYWVLLYSGVQNEEASGYSYLAHRLSRRIEGDDCSVLSDALTRDRQTFDNSWFGYFGYGLKNSLEKLTIDKPGWPDLPNLCMMQFECIYVFDHRRKTLSLWSAAADVTPLTPKTTAHIDIPRVVELTSNMSTTTYLEKAAYIIERIHAGDLYQANLTRKFSGKFESAPDALALFGKLCRISPAAYSAYMRLGDVHVCSSSPELFLEIGKEGRMHSRPIKGSAGRAQDAKTDRDLRHALAHSDKDRAENLMIVDLMRNDFSKSCQEGSVKAYALFDVATHATIHHMTSSIDGQMRDDCTALDAITRCFPPGSMTGAPKIKAMELCSALEGDARGLYSGAIGWLGGDGSAALSVVIRTLLVGGDRFEFQVGGGIVADSTPQRELEELLDKAKGIALSLGITRRFLENL